jgi:hypothetical protein
VAERPVNFLMNPTSWDDAEDAPVPGGMAMSLVDPILPHLEVPHTVSRTQRRNAVNVYYSHRRKYRAQRYGTFPERSVFISHGIADKSWRDGRRVAKEWDFIFVSGPAWSNKMRQEGVPVHKIIEVGYTKLDPIFQGAVPTPERDERIRVVWAPTHGGGGENEFGRPGLPLSQAARRSSHHHAETILDALPEDAFDVVIAPHPRHRADGRSTLVEYVGADVVVADSGSTVYEAWSLDLPVVAPTWLTGDAFRYGGLPSFEHDIYRKRIGRHAASPEQFGRLVREAAAGGITSEEADFIEGIFPRRYRGVSGRMHAEALDDIASGRDVRHTARFMPVRFVKTFDDHRAVHTWAGSDVDRRLSLLPEWTRLEGTR